MRAYLFVLLLLLVIFGGIGGYLYNKFTTLANTDFTPPPITIAGGTARNAVWPTRLEAVGTIRAARGVELSAETAGEVISVHARSGEQVRANQLLVTLNDSVEQASLERQEANLTLAEILHKRDASLIRQNSIPQSQYDRSRADLDSAIAQLAETRARLENKRIVAPFAGTTGIMRVKVGDYVDTGAPITTLQDLSELEVDFSVPARHYPNLRPGLTITVTTDAFPDKTFSATLEALDARVDAGTRNLALRAVLADTQGLLPGMFARLVIDLDQPQKVVTVPETAVSYSIHGDTVWVLRQGIGETTAHPRVVEAGQSRDGEVAILSGLRGGEWIVTVGQNKLHRGARVMLDDDTDL
ncbi:MAG: efflux RND transporter periplasmic adaptor subunit [Gammaproteobacteria bacterium]|nr:efflux RND transporter periplasmic adaptor subunit [Gammaproteobacteria bacterium]